MTEILALIPARGGSKGIPHKNIRNFAGYPLIAWSIAAAKQSKMITRIIVSTDDEEIAAVARECGAETPFLRPAELAQDKSTDLPVFEHALKWLKEAESYKPEIVVQLRPTSPIRPRGMVDAAINILINHKDADCVRGIVLATQNPHKMWRFDGDNKPMKPLLKVEGIAEPYNAPRQILPPIYWQTGHIDAIRVSIIAKKHSLTGDVIYPLIIDPRYTVDIDSLPDWAKYEALVYSGLEMISPGDKSRRRMPEKIKMIITDFDGVITDGRVWTDENGHETVAASRSDSMRIRELRERGIEVMILSSEVNPVVKARATKMGIDAIHGLSLSEKGEALRKFLSEKNLDASQIVYLGNDFNDLPCFEVAGWAVAVADAYPEVLRVADHVLKTPGGYGALRELCDLILNRPGRF
ncbi:MAG: acylneuraminate cytidylyltransferase [Anaerolineales bacterium]|nr:acylneuraminate cytidylyltransferase [Anaerolineales bacterium]